ncbi:DNA recombination protein RmuC [Wenyingzhuangia heitensis]|uniref:DNA recombination protein RmuC n=1 Tax=Wenyingzhuangia heitensis TaxID=1487859 RepID=A0ABX0UCC6_9FLAO|nr:DNA recombination protein RmuC [Wenyingzhuangia heitensis]NIJ44806.1 DNA recombination protein RmuC [Wenyingzhuangia heitensis]
MEMIFMLISLLIGGGIGFVIAKKITALQADKEATAANEQLVLLQKENQYQLQNAKEQIARLDQLLVDHKLEAQKQLENSKKELEELRTQKETQILEINKEKEVLAVTLERANAKTEELTTDLQENKAEIEKLQEKFTKEFENLANKILEEKSKTFSDQNQKNINDILKPLQEKIQSFEKKVEDTNKEGIERNSGLRQQIESLKDLNNRMSKDAENLTKALKGDSKTQGNWGEMILERVLEKSGLEKGREYELEKSFDTDAESKTRLRPDVIINLPDNRKMIVDSKVTLTAYEKLVGSDDETERVQYIKEHLLSLHRHIDQLSAKKYSELYQIESPDFVLMFIPIEPAFALALEQDTDLYNKAFAKNIVIVTPSTLLATLRTIESMWKNEKQQKNALEIATQATRLYEQFVSLTEELIKLGKQLKTVEGTYDTTMKKLTGRGNLIVKVENLKQLGIKTNSKEFNQKLLERASEES